MKIRIAGPATVTAGSGGITRAAAIPVPLQGLYVTTTHGGTVTNVSGSPIHNHLSGSVVSGNGLPDADRGVRHTGKGRRWVASLAR